MTSCALQVGMYVRLFGVLADRPELLAADIGQRLDKARSLTLLDRILVANADDVDYLCGYSVRKLRTTRSAALLDALGVLSPSRIIAIAFAVDAKRRSVVLNDAVFAYHVQRTDPEAVKEALAFWNDLPDLRASTDMSFGAQDLLNDHIRTTERAMVGLGVAL